MSIGQSMLFLLELLPLQLRRSCDYSSFPRRLLAGPGHCWAIGSASPMADGPDSLQDAHRAQLGFVTEVSLFPLLSHE